MRVEEQTDHPSSRSPLMQLGEPTMSITPANNAACSHVSQVPPAASSKSAASSAAEEANETGAKTRQEAAHGDQVAIRRLARQEQAKRLANPGAAPETPVAQRGGIDRLA